MKHICIMTQEEVDKGYRVVDDVVISTIRGIKRKLGIAKNNMLYVSEGAKEEYMKKRKAFEKRVLWASIAIALTVVFLWFLPIIRGDFNLFISNIVPVLVLAVVLALFILMGYLPRIEDRITIIKVSKGGNAAKKPASTKKARKGQKARKASVKAEKASTKAVKKGSANKGSRKRKKGE